MDRTHLRWVSRAAILALALFTPGSARAAEPTWPSAREVWHDDFEAPALSDIWEDQGNGHITVGAAAAHPPSLGGLAVDVTGADQLYLQRYDLTDWPHLLFPRD